MSIYLSIPTVQGTATAEGYEGWIHIQFCEFNGITNPFPMVVAQEGDRFDTKPRFDQVLLHKTLDSSSNALFQAAATGRVFPYIEINYVTTGNPPFTYYKLKLHDVVITHFEDAHDGSSGLPHEMITLAYTKIERTYIGRDHQNTEQSPNRTGYDLPKAAPL